MNKKSVANREALAVGPIDMASVENLPPPTQARGGDLFPNHEVCAHSGVRYRLFDDLIRDKVVMINFMSIDSHASFPASDYLSNIANQFAERLGHDVFMYSITTKPAVDDVKALNSFAIAHGVRPGWLFLRTEKPGVDELSHRLMRDKHHSGGAMHGALGHPSRIIHYGNGGVGLWGACACDTNPSMVFDKITWLQPGQRPGTEIRRAGPRRLSSTDHLSHNREV